VTARRPQPRVQRHIPSWMAHPARQPAPRDNPWLDAAVVGWCVVALGVIYVIATRTGWQYAPGTLMALAVALYATNRAWKR
jgi:hypothetical protein